MHVRRAASWAAVVALVCSTAGIGASAEASTARANPARASAEVQAAADPTTTDLFGKKFSSWLLDKAAGAAASEGFGMIFSLSGLNQLITPDPNGRLLQDILKQLTLIQQSIEVLTGKLDELIRQLNQDNLDRLLIELRQRVTIPLDHLFTHEFERVVEAAERYADALEHNPVLIRKTYDNLIARRNEFFTAYDACCRTAAASIHAFLVPGPGSVTAALGRVLAGEHRYLTSEVAADVRNLYDQFADWEALAAWMAMERNLPAVDPGRVPSGVFPGSMAAYNQARRTFLGYRRAEARNVVPAVPANVVIDVSAAASSTSLAGARMYVPTATGLTYQPGVEGAGSVTHAVTELNARHAEGRNDWRVPTQPELAQLLAGKPAQPSSTVGAFLRSLNPTSLDWSRILSESWRFLWSGTEVSRTTSCWIYRDNLPVRDRNHRVRTHTAVSLSTTTPAWAGRPEVPPTAPGREPRRPTDEGVCDVWIPRLFAAGTGALMAVRTVEAMPIDYLGRGPGPTLRPSAHLRDADLSGLDLTGTDLTDADLTGATLTDAVFTDDEGATGLNLTRALLDGVTSGGIVGDATLPTGWHLTNGYLIGPGADLTGADLRGADLTSANLRGVTSGGVDCTGCKLPVGWRWTGSKSGFLVGPGADLRGAGMGGVDLTGVDLTGALLTGADLTRANLARALMRDVDLTDVSLRGSTLTGAEISRSTVSGTDLTGASMVGVRGYSLTSTPRPPTLPALWTMRAGVLVGPTANLARLPLVHVDLRAVHAAGADLTGANLASADLTGADLQSANLTGAKLTGANLTGATIVDARITNATVTDATLTTDDNKLAGIVSGGLVGAPRALPASGRYRMAQGYLVGPSANLAGATFTSNAQLGGSLSGTNFTGATLAGVNLAGATLRNAIFTDARLTGANLTGADMGSATLDGVRSGGIVGTPSLPRDWRVLGRFLVGPAADLGGADLAGLNLTLVDLRAADLRAANLTGANLSGANLEGADLAGSVLADVRWAVTMCPDGVRTTSTPCAPAVWRGTSTTTASASNNGGSLNVDVAPALSAGVLWEVLVQRRAESGGWVRISSHTTRGPGDTLRLNLPAGTYRAVVWPQKRYRGSASQAVVLTR